MKYFFLSVFFLFAFSAPAAAWEESLQIGELFKSAGVKGTFALYDAGAQRYIGHNEARAHQRFVPASTFKIPNSLIGLSTGAVKSIVMVIPYKGPPRPFIPAWARDMGLREAIALSNVPLYQELARRIGLE